MIVKQIEQLKSEKRWVLWHSKKETDAQGNVQWRKVPDQITERGERYKGASSTDPSTWATYAEAKAALDRNGDRFQGIGIVFNGDGLVGIDIDGEHDSTKDVRNPKEAEVREIIGDTYTEVSPSGNGLHLLAWADLSVLPAKRYEGTNGGSYAAWDKDKYKSKLDWVENGVKYGLEIYPSARFFTFTGNTLDGLDTIETRTEGVRKALDRFMLKTPAASAPGKPSKGTRANRNARANVTPIPTVFNAAEVQGDVGTIAHSEVGTAFDPLAERPISPEDDWKITRLIDRRLNVARKAQNGEKFIALYDRGDVNTYNNGDDSSADNTLCLFLLHYLNHDFGLVDRAFRASALMRDKWNRKDYREGTLNTALQQALGFGDTPYKDSDAVNELKYKPQNINDGGDGGIADVFLSYAGKHLLWCRAYGWLAWDGTRWKIDDNGAKILEQRFAAAMLTEATEFFYNTLEVDPLTGKTTADPVAAKYLKAAQYARTTRGMEQILKQAEPRQCIEAKQVDADPFVIATPEGLCDLRTGEMRKTTPRDIVTKLTACGPSDQGAEEWNAFLDLITCNDADLKAFLRRVGGMICVGMVKTEVLIVAYGNGRNGKSSLFSALSRVLADYATPINPEVLIKTTANKKADIASLHGVRLAVASELEAGVQLSTQELKQLTSVDPIPVERKYKECEKVEPSHTLVLVSNHLPKVPAEDAGTWRRLLVLPFDAVMPEGDAEVMNMGEHLARTCGGAIMQWLLDGAKEFCANGFKLKPCAAVREASAAYRNNSNWISEFVRERCERDSKAREKARDVYQAYQVYSARSEGGYTRSPGQVEQALKRMGFTLLTPGNVSTWKGLRLRADEYGWNDESESTNDAPMDWNDPI